MVIQVATPSDSSASFSFWCRSLILMNINLHFPRLPAPLSDASEQIRREKKKQSKHKRGLNIIENMAKAFPARCFFFFFFSTRTGIKGKKYA